MVLGLLASALAYRFYSKRLWSESFLFGTFTLLITIGILILTKLITIPSLITNEFVLLPLSYAVAALLLTAHPRFRIEKPLNFALIIGGGILLIKILVVSIDLFIQLGVTI